ncbi:type III polyketide synthase [Virgibacillus halodenitrificans]|uniref:type III polyketide synthase n=1 Tax=Virgibacillus halodenitrificans TaxID=1482 RepID=UPI001F3284CE|nr:3-oxoacyl-[acyl-carrier-protein] synthase III C-terminal domain-containing protein [Virgibacillus halodenitrificans]
MTHICSTGIGVPEYEIGQGDIKKLVQEIFVSSDKRLSRLLSVFDNAQVEKRQFAVPATWFKEDHSFKERNDLYKELAIQYSLNAIDDCLTNQDFLEKEVPYEAIDMIIYVSSTGISTPSIDAHLIHERPFREDVNRMPIWGLGCAGGAIALSRAHDWITANPDKTVLIICCELCSLTFQKGDMKKSNIIGSALFGDGVCATLAVGKNSPYLSYRKHVSPKLLNYSSLTKKGSASVMGWNVTNSGLEVVFSKSIPSLVQTFWDRHINSFLKENKITEKQISSFISHPGGKKVLEAMREVLNTTDNKLKHSYKVLSQHGNMSSPTVLYVLRQWMIKDNNRGEKSIISALGPGFSSELILMEWE